MARRRGETRADYAEGMYWAKSTAESLTGSATFFGSASDGPVKKVLGFKNECN